MVKGGGKGGGRSKAKASARGSKKKDVFSYDDEEQEVNKGRALGHEKDRDGIDSDEEHAVKKGDDESIEDDASDIGWDSDDEICYGKIVNKGKVEEKDEDDEDEDDEDGGMLLSEMVKGGTVFKAPSSSSASQEDKIDDQEEESEGDEDESDSEEDEEDLENVHNRLLSAIDKFAKQGSAEENDTAASSISKNQQAPESVFGSSASDGKDGMAVSMDALLGALDDNKDLNVVKSRLNTLENRMKAPQYVEKVHADRAERKVAYDGTTTEMGKWQEVVTTNRNARTLDIANDQRRVPKYRDLVKKFKPEEGTMEEEIQMVLVGAKATDETRQQKEEEDELGGRTLTMAELRERQAELAKTKALLFYEQMKRHRINKIKSKSFHRIKKRQRMRRQAAEEKMIEETDPELYAQMQEEAATDRVRERMNLKHRSTSAFAKKMLQHAHGDKSMRQAYNESLALGSELKERIEGRIGGDGSDDEEGHGDNDSLDDSDSDEGGVGADGKRKKKKKVAALAAKALLAANILDGGGAGDGESGAVQGKYQKLFDMDFMKRAQDSQRERARQEAKDVLKELEDMEEDDDDDSDAGGGGGGGGGGEGKEGDKAQSKQRLKEARAEISALFGQSKGKGHQLRQGKSFSSQQEEQEQEGNEQEEEEEGQGGGAEANPWMAAPEVSRSLAAAAGDDSKGKGKGKSKGKGKGKGKGTPAADMKSSAGKKKESDKDKAAENEVYVSLDRLVGREQGDTAAASEGKKGKKKGDKAPATAVPEAEKPAATSSSSSSSSEGTEGASGSGAGNGKGKAKKKTLLAEQSQEELVSAAFAGPDYSEDFEQFKEKQVHAELGIDNQKAKILKDVKAGWGDWAGPGKEISDKILKKRDRMVAAVEADAAQKKKTRRDSKMPNVVLSDRRVKTAGKYKITGVPHPFTSREEYEQSLRMPVGEEWNASHVVRANTKPEIMLRAGRVVEPLKLSKRVNKDAKEQRMSGATPAPGPGVTANGNRSGTNKRKFKG